MSSSDDLLRELDEIFVVHGGIFEAMERLNYSERCTRNIVKCLSEKRKSSMNYDEEFIVITCDLFANYFPSIGRYLDLLKITQQTFGSWLLKSLEEVMEKRRIRLESTLKNSYFV